MSEIKAGDLVIVIRSYCGNEGKIGIAEGPAAPDVEHFNPAHGPRVWVRLARPVQSVWGIEYNPAPFPLSCLRRIDGTPETVKTDEEITA